MYTTQIRPLISNPARAQKTLATQAAPFLAAIALGGGGSPAALGQQLESERVLAEVVVTARKRTERLQETPLAISAQSGEMLANAAIDDLSEAARFVPNVSLTKGGAIAGSNAAASIFIRGVGQGDFIVSSDPGVGVYIDGVYYARMVGAAMELSDVERVEILRGPQGTLFGRNTIGGAINILSVQPEPHWSGKVSATGGQNEHFALKGSLNAPLSDEIYARFNVLRRVRGGYVDALSYDGVELGDEDVSSVRGQLRFDGDGYDVNVSLDYTEQEDYGAPWVAEAIAAPGADPTFNYLFSSFANLFTGDPSCLTTAGQQTNPTCFGPVWQPENRFATNNTFRDVETGQLIRPYSRVENFGASVTAQVDLDFAELKSISAFRRLDSGFTRSLSQTPLVTFQNTTRVFDSEQYSQELQLTGTALDRGLDWVTGFYYFKEDAIEIDDLVTSLFRRTDDTFEVQNRSIALLANLTYHVNDRLRLTGGARWTREEKDGKGAAPNFIDPVSGLPAPTLLTSSQEVTEVTPSASIAYQFTPRVLGYVSYAEGYKSGTFSPRLPFPNLAGPSLPTADPEYVRSYETGLKSDLAGNRLRLNLAAFYAEYDDIQIAYIPPSNPANTIAGNIASAEVSGLEIELQAQLGSRLSVQASLGLLDARYTRLDYLPTPFFSRNTPLQRTPDYQGNLGVSYIVPLAAGELAFIADWSTVDRHALFSDNAARDYAFADAWSSGNLAVSYTPTQGQWKVALHVENVTDEVHKTAAVDVMRDTFGVAEVIYNRPREAFVTVSYEF